MRCSSPPTLLCPLSASCLAPAVPRPNEVLSRRRPGPLSKPPPHYTYCWLYSQSVSGSVPASAMMESTIATPPTTPGMAYTVASMHVYTAHASPSQHMCVIRACNRSARPRASMQRACAHAHRSVPAAQDLSHPPPLGSPLEKGDPRTFTVRQTEYRPSGIVRLRSWAVYAVPGRRGMFHAQAPGQRRRHRASCCRQLAAPFSTGPCLPTAGRHRRAGGGSEEATISTLRKRAGEGE